MWHLWSALEQSYYIFGAESGHKHSLGRKWNVDKTGCAYLLSHVRSAEANFQTNDWNNFIFVFLRKISRKNEKYRRKYCKFSGINLSFFFRLFHCQLSIPWPTNDSCRDTSCKWDVTWIPWKMFWMFLSLLMLFQLGSPKIYIPTIQLGAIDSLSCYATRSHTEKITDLIKMSVWFSPWSYLCWLSRNSYFLFFFFLSISP